MSQLALCQEERDAYRDERDRLEAVNAKLLSALERFVKAAPAGRYRPTGNDYGAALTAARDAIEEARK